MSRKCQEVPNPTASSGSRPSRSLRLPATRRLGRTTDTFGTHTLLEHTARSPNDPAWIQLIHSSPKSQLLERSNYVGSLIGPAPGTVEVNVQSVAEGDKASDDAIERVTRAALHHRTGIFRYTNKTRPIYCPCSPCSPYGRVRQFRSGRGVRLGQAYRTSSCAWHRHFTADGRGSPRNDTRDGQGNPPPRTHQRARRTGPPRTPAPPLAIPQADQHPPITQVLQRPLEPADNLPMESDWAGQWPMISRAILGT